MEKRSKGEKKKRGKRRKEEKGNKGKGEKEPPEPLPKWRLCLCFFCRNGIPLTVIRYYLYQNTLDFFR